jgi:hypothetical protein
MRALRFSALFFFLLAILAPIEADDHKLSGKGATNGIVVLEGRVAPAPGSGTNLLFKADGGAIYSLLRTAPAEALFLDTDLHSKVLLLKGKVVPDKRTFEVTGNLHSVKDGKVHKLYYYCDVCSITSTIPGLCQCCREPVKLVEEPEK